MEQREGRIVRQGNMNDEVAIYRYVAKATFDAYSWQTIERKASYIDQILSGKSDVRSIEDITEKTMSYQETKAIAAENPILFKKFTIDSQVQQLLLLEKAFKDQKYRIIHRIDSYKNDIAEAEEYIKACKCDLDKANANTIPGDEFEIFIGKKRYDERPAAGEAILELLGTFTNNIGEEEEQTIGTYKGFEIVYQKRKSWINNSWVNYLAVKGTYIYKFELSESAIGNITKLENIIKGFEPKIIEKENLINRLSVELVSLEQQTNLPFKDAEKLKDLLIEQSNIDRELAVHQGIIGAGVQAEEDNTELQEAM